MFRSPLFVPAGLLCALLLGACADRKPPLVSLPAEPPQRILIERTNVLEVATGRLISNRNVLIEGDRIVRIASATRDTPPDDALRIDGRGATLLPGLVDMHAHVGFSSAPRWRPELPDPARNLQAYLYAGVTTVLDVGGMDNRIFRLREQVASGQLPGPRIYAAGPQITTVGGHPVAIIDRLVPWWIRWYIKRHQVREVDAPAAARAAVDEIAGLGADVVKLIIDRIPESVPRLEQDIVRAAVEQARGHGIRTVAHIGSTADARMTGAAGVSLWVHGVYKERIPDPAIAELADFGIPMVPTTVVWENYAGLGRRPRSATQLERETVAADLLAAFDEVPETADAEFFRPWLDALEAQRPHWRDNVRRLHAAGVTILAGSDMQAGVFPGAGLHRELALLVESGLTPGQAIRAATLDAARFLEKSPQPDFGRVAPGTRADLLLVDGNPLTDIGVLARIRAVLVGGALLNRQPVTADAG